MIKNKTYEITLFRWFKRVLLVQYLCESALLDYERYYFVVPNEQTHYISISLHYLSVYVCIRRLIVEEGKQCKLKNVYVRTNRYIAGSRFLYVLDIFVTCRHLLGIYIIYKNIKLFSSNVFIYREVFGTWWYRKLLQSSIVGRHSSAKSYLIASS